MSSEVSTSWERRCHMVGVGAVVAAVGITTVVLTVVSANGITTDPSWQENPPWQKTAALTAATTGIPATGLATLCGLAKIWKCFCSAGDGGGGRDCNVIKF